MPACQGLQQHQRIGADVLVVVEAGQPLLVVLRVRRRLCRRRLRGKLRPLRVLREARADGQLSRVSLFVCVCALTFNWPSSPKKENDCDRLNSGMSDMPTLIGSTAAAALCLAVWLSAVWLSLSLSLSLSLDGHVLHATATSLATYYAYVD